MIKSSFDYYTLTVIGKTVRISGCQGATICDFDIEKVQDEIAKEHGGLPAILRRLDKLEGESYKQQDVDDIDCKLAATMERLDNVDCSHKILVARVDAHWKSLDALDAEVYDLRRQYSETVAFVRNLQASLKSM